MIRRLKSIITDKLRSYAAAEREVLPGVEHRSHKGLNNRAENSHVPLRRRERMTQGFRSVGDLQRFVSVFSAVRITSRHRIKNARCWPPTSIGSTPWPSGKP